MIIKCKMCGGDLAYTEGSTVCECEYCGSMQTIVNPDNEKKTNLFNRANRLRMNSEFDKAAALYEQLAAEFPEEAEAYWGLCLCNYGIEYVDDPATGRKMPTCHRTLTASVMEDANFEQACDYADSVARKVYREEAKAIDRIQKEILSIAASEAPYDVFICYKETAEDGGRTEDSVLAQDLYDALTAKGLKVFFSRITLEDKLGVQYEPYIYAALSSAKVMLAVGTAFEYYDAVWVKNEWSRFLAMMKEDRSKTLIPCFKNLDAYDMPKEFKGLQAQDMSKLGWLQDVTRGVLKLCGKDMVQPAQMPVQQAVIREAAPAESPAVNLMKRVYLFLEDGNFDQAAEYIDKALDADAEYAPAYVGKVLIRHRLKNVQALSTLKEPIYEDPDWQKALRFSDAQQKQTYLNYVNEINYADAAAKMKRQELCRAIIAFTALEDYKDSKVRLKECIDVYREQLIDREMAAGKIDPAMTAAKGKAVKAQHAYEEAQAAVRSAEKEKTETEKREKALPEEISRLSSELGQVRGLFSGGKKRELEGKIDSLKRELNGIARKKSECEQTASKAKAEAETAESVLSEAKAALTEMETKFREEVLTRWTDEAVIAAAPAAAAREPYTKVGNIVTYGHYKQDSNNGKEPIEWIVLKYDGASGKSLLISRYGLDARFDASNYQGWEKSENRYWLNSTFLNAAFTAKEQAGIVMTKVSTPSYSGNSGGPDTQDKLWLLSLDEAETYFKTAEARKTIATKYAVAQGADQYSGSDSSCKQNGTGCCWWWLRSPGNFSSIASYVYGNGILNKRSDCVFCSNGSIRPAFWLDLDSADIY